MFLVFLFFLLRAFVIFLTTIPVNFLVDCVLVVHCFCADFMANMRLFHLSSMSQCFAQRMNAFPACLFIRMKRLGCSHL
ncbi:hypothetical protein P879_05006 [Paragonimus westermani]|uniref:Uncharacterized protein n=1 Tax=Paragonimus westermani TaxID=34504 RepID=A0A8T0CY95_9TREM|nr:hypothetical protein P879_05006 [Paragonimus westermani]